MFNVPEQSRITFGHFKSDASDGNNGLFKVILKTDGNKRAFSIIASDGQGWEHVSVSLPDRCPSWGEMCKIKDIFWGEDDCVVQYHPPKSDYVNNHPFCLHLWRQIDVEFARPKSILVGEI